MKKWLKRFLKEEDGLGTLEILLIIAVLVAVALLFRDRITSFVTDLLDKTGTKVDNF